MRCSCPCQKPTLDLDESPYDQDTFFGRAQHCFRSRNPLYLLASKHRVERAQCLVLKYKCGEVLPANITERELWNAKFLYESAFHPYSGEKVGFFGRTVSQIPINAVILGSMMTFYRKTPSVVIWQWLNQSYVALVHNIRSDDNSSTKRALASYFLATSVAIGTALSLANYTKCMPPLVQRYVPFVAVAAGSLISVPIVKAQELRTGIPVFDDEDSKLAYSKIAAQKAVSQTVLNKVLWIAPGMLATPVLLDLMEKRGTLCRYPWLALPSAIGTAGLMLAMISPFFCALFREKGSIPVKHLEDNICCDITKRFKCDPPRYVYYYRGVI